MLSSEESGEDEPPELQNEIQRVADFVSTSNALRSLHDNLRHFLDSFEESTRIASDPAASASKSLSTVGSTKTYRGFWEAWPSGVNLNSLPFDLRSLTASQIELQKQYVKSTFDGWKIMLEQYSGESWIWWPMEPPQSQASSGYHRVKWKCHCGKKQLAAIPATLAQRLGKFLAKPQICPTGSNSDGHVPSHNASSSLIYRPGSSSGPFCARHTSLFSASGSASFSTVSPAQATQSNGRLLLQGHGTRSLFVLLCVYRGDHLRYTQIHVKNSTDYSAFVDAVLHEYRGMVGKIRYWLHPRALSFCSFMKFTRDSSEHLSRHRAPELPFSDDYHYENKPSKGDPYALPISEHEWYDHFYGKIKYLNRCRCALARIPKRDRRFMFSTHTGREDMFGLFAERKPSFFRVAM